MSKKKKRGGPASGASHALRSPWSSALAVNRYTYQGVVAVEGGEPKATAAVEKPGKVTIDDAWRLWVAENLLRRCDPRSLVDAMVRAGIDRASAQREIESAVHHPYVRAARQVGAGPAAANEDAKLRKRDWVLECYRRNARQATTRTVPRLPKLSREHFLNDYYALNRPVVMTGAFDDWPAMRTWSLAELRRRFGERIVSVQANRGSDANYEQNSDKLRKQMRFAEFVDIVQGVGESNDYYITANNSGTNRAALKELWDDVVFIPEYLRPTDDGNSSFFWFGPKGTVTPLHHDLTNNFMAQVLGRKLVRLIPPFELPSIYNHRHCFTEVDLDRPDYERFPLFRDVAVIDVEIGPGDLLFVPVGWWHYVRSLDVSITMTFTNFVFDNDFYSFYTTYQDI